MYSVTSDPATSLSFQAAAPKPARPDPSQATDSFGALVDSSIPANTGNDQPVSAAPQPQPAPQRTSDNSPAASDDTSSRNAAPADRSDRHDSDDRNGDAQQASDAGADANSAATRPSRGKTDGSKAGTSKSSEKSSSDKTAKADQAASGQAAGSPVTAPNAVAVAVQVTAASTGFAGAAQAQGGGTAPLAIAAAAIAASTSTTAAAAASAQLEAGATATPATADAAGAAAAAAAKIAAQAEANGKTPVKQASTGTDATAASDAALTVAATGPAVPKTTLTKAATTGLSKTAAATAKDAGKSESTATDTPTATAANGTAQQPAASAKPADGDLAGDTPAGTAPAPATIVAAHDHAQANGAGHTSTDSSDIGIQATGAIQPQLPPAPATLDPTAPLSVTAATNAAVPLSGLALEIAASVKSGKSSFEIRLDPADLGRIDVRIDVDRTGQVTSHLTVEKPETLTMLRQDAPQLQQALDNAGFKTGDGGLQFSLRDQSSSGQNNNGNETGRNAQRLVISNDDSIPAVIAGQSYGRSLGSSSGVDIRV